jgi:hypothetical protein
MAAGENCAYTSVLAGDGGVVWLRCLVEGIIFSRLVISLWSCGSCRFPAGGVGATSSVSIKEAVLGSLSS